MDVPRVLAAPMRRGAYAVGMVSKRKISLGRKGTYGMTLMVYGKKAVWCVV